MQREKNLGFDTYMDLIFFLNLSLKLLRLGYSVDSCKNDRCALAKKNVRLSRVFREKAIKYFQQKKKGSIKKESVEFQIFRKINHDRYSIWS